MIIQRTGELEKDLYLLCSSHIPMYLMKSPTPALFDAGFSFMGPRYVQEIRDLLGDRTPAYLFVTHSHYDHLGAVSYIKSKFPDLQVCCAERVEKILKKESAVELMRSLTLVAVEMAEGIGIDMDRTEPFQPFSVDRILADGDRIDLGGGLSVEVIATPGHTRDSLSYYIPERKILFCSEAAGIPDDTGYIFSEWLVDYDMYLTSIQRLCELDVETLCLGHGYVMTGTDASEYLPRSMQHCVRLREQIEDCLAEEDNQIERVIRRIKKMEYDGKPGVNQPEPAYLLNVEARVRAIQKRLAASAGCLEISKRTEAIY
jgi:glyoxylase-like metal-dependent hydrolase (beta-lactamase superfamily II)